MAFVYPGFLWALAALAVPLLIHLFHFRRYRTVYFTNVRFLKEVVEETRTRQKLRHWLVMALRMLAIAGLVLAFAQPVLPGAAETQSARRSVSVFVDNSPSMDALGEDRSLFEQARDRARRIAEAHGPDDRFQLITADLEGSQQRLLDRDQFLDALDALTLSPEAPLLQSVYQRQRDAVQQGPGDAQVYLISDFQKSAGSVEADTQLTHFLLPMEGQTPRNLSVDSVWLSDPLPLPGQRATLHFRVRNYGRQDAEAVSIKLFFDAAEQRGLALEQEGGAAGTSGQGRQIRALTERDIPGGGSVEDTLVFTVPEAGWQLGEVQLTDYPVSFDDRWFFSLLVPEFFSVLTLSEASVNPFLQVALGENPRFALDHANLANVDYTGLGNYGLIVLDGLNAVPPGLADELLSYLRAGGQVLGFPGPQSTTASWDAFLQPLQIRLAGRSTQVRPVSELRSEHPLFDGVFAKVPENLSLPEARLSCRVQASAASREDPLMLFSDGSPFLARYPVGSGQLLFCASPLERSASDLPAQGGILVPLLVKLGAASSLDRPLGHLLGQAGWISVAASGIVPVSEPGAERLPEVRGPSGQPFLPEARPDGRGWTIRLDDAAREAGHYRVAYAADGAAREALLGHVSFNFARRESDLQAWTREDLSAAMDGATVRFLDSDPERLSADLERLASGRRLWKACLILALICLALEALLLRWPFGVSRESAKTGSKGRGAQPA
jgi:hypothetical protein